jgi:hypothetical protein
MDKAWLKEPIGRIWKSYRRRDLAISRMENGNMLLRPSVPRWQDQQDRLWHAHT